MSPIEPQEPYKIPSVLRVRPRRIEVRLIVAFSLCLSWLFTLPCAIATNVLPWAGLLFQAWALFGTDHRAQVVLANYSTTTSKDQTPEHFQLTWVYEQNGVERRGTDSVSKTEFKRVGGSHVLQVESPPYGQVTVRAIGSPPLYYARVVSDRQNSPAGYWSGLLMFALTVTFTAFWDWTWGVLLWRSYVVPWQMWRMCRWGIPTPGFIVSKYKGGYMGFGYVEYYYVINRHRTGHGRMTLIQNGDFQRAQKGDRVTVLCDEGNPSSAIVYEYAVYTCL